eukprot:330594-Chlamydomonas_euryale.AAC.9
MQPPLRCVVNGQRQRRSGSHLTTSAPAHGQGYRGCALHACWARTHGLWFYGLWQSKSFAQYLDHMLMGAVLAILLLLVTLRQPMCPPMQVVQQLDVRSRRFNSKWLSEAHTLSSPCRPISRVQRKRGPACGIRVV